MTEEQKAKAYDNVHQKILVRFGSNVVKEIFSEYEESEDERIKKALIECLKRFSYDRLENNGVSVKDAIAWLEKQDDKVIACHQNYQDIGKPNGGIVLEDFNGGEGFIKLHLDYLTKKQVEDVEKLVRMWNKETSDDIIRACIGMCLTDADEQRFKDFNTTLKDCLDWLEKQCEKQKSDGTFVNVDDVRESFMNTVYNILSDDPTNDRANDIINAFDNLPSITINNQYPQILANSAKTCKNKQKLLPKCGQLHNN